MTRFGKKLINMVAAIAIALLTIPMNSGECAEKYPSRPLTLIVNYGAGGSTDVAARLFAGAAEKTLGVPIVIVNKPGGGGTLGVTELSRAKPDGYTIGTLPTTPIVVIPLMQAVAYDPFKSFEYVCAYGRYVYGIFTKADSPFKSIRDVVEASRKKPGSVTYASYSTGVSVGFKFLEQQEKIKLTAIPVKSGQEAVTNLIGGHVDLGIGSEFVPFLTNKEVRGLAAVSVERLGYMPDVPTFIELGYDIDITGWMGLGAPAGTSIDQVNIICRAFEEAGQNPAVKEKMATLGLDAPFQKGNEIKGMYMKQTAIYKPLIDIIVAEQKK